VSLNTTNNKSINQSINQSINLYLVTVLFYSLFYLTYVSVCMWAMLPENKWMVCMYVYVTDHNPNLPFLLTLTVTYGINKETSSIYQFIIK